MILSKTDCSTVGFNNKLKFFGDSPILRKLHLKVEKQKRQTCLADKLIIF